MRSGADGATNCRDQATSDLLVDQGLARVLALGDHQYGSGALSAFQSYYDPTWGRVKKITSPAPGNHDPFSSGYSAYFGPRAPARYYSYDIGQWHLISLDSNNVDSTQVTWLRSDLAANAGGKCVLAYWHHPRFSSGTTHGNSTTGRAVLDRALQRGRRSRTERPRAQLRALRSAGSERRGLRRAAFASSWSGPGARAITGSASPQPNSEARRTGTFGVLELALRPGAYEWLFVPEAGKSFSDSGTGVCNNATPDGYPRPIVRRSLPRLAGPVLRQLHRAQPHARPPARPSLVQTSGAGVAVPHGRHVRRQRPAGDVRRIAAAGRHRRRPRHPRERGGLQDHARLQRHPRQGRPLGLHRRASGAPAPASPTGSTAPRLPRRRPRLPQLPGHRAVRTHARDRGQRLQPHYDSQHGPAGRRH